MEHENGDALSTMRSVLVDVMDKIKNEPDIDKETLKDIIVSISILINIIDNHEARLKLIERCFNKVKETYYNINIE